MFVQKTCAQLFCKKNIVGIRRLDKQRRMFIIGFDEFTQTESCIRISYAVVFIAHVGDYTQKVVFEFVVQANGIFIGCGEQNFWTATHTKHLLMFV